MPKNSFVKLDRQQAFWAIASVRFILATVGWVAPGALGRVMGTPPNIDVAATYPMRLFASRDAFMGVSLVATEGEHRRQFLRLGVLVDLGDALASALAGRTGALSRGGAAFCTVLGLIGASLGAAADGRGPLAAETAAGPRPVGTTQPEGTAPSGRLSPAAR